MKYAIRMTERLERTVMVEAASSEEAMLIVENAYDECKLELHADNSDVYVEFNDVTEEHIQLCGKETFETREVTEELLVESD